MDSGKLKIKPNRKVELTVKGKDQSNIKEFDFSGFEPNTYDCEVETSNGKPVRIVVNGKDVPKNDDVVKRREEDDKRKKAEEDAKREQEKLAKQEAQQRAYPENVNVTNDAFKLDLAQVPSDTRRLTVLNPDNFSLKLNKFARLETTYDKNNEAKLKFEFFKKGKFQIQANFKSIDFQQIASREIRNAHVLFSPAKTQSLWVVPQGRLIVGLGGESVYETALTLHHVFGFPFIPASSVKGVVRSWIITTVFEKDETGAIDLKNAEKRAKQHEDFCLIFGSDAENHDKTARQGEVTFFDAYPTSAPRIETDLMNPHYGEYYDKTKQVFPTDTQSPVPVFFLTVAGAPFQFIIASKKWDLTKLFKGKTLENWLKEALQNHGIGAKTAVGYGYMK
jgi:CRISPR-associated protein Cmr6